MAWRMWVLGTCLVVGCGKTSSNADAAGDSAHDATQASAASSTGTGIDQGSGGSAATFSTANAGVTTTGVALSCTFPEDRECNGACVDARTDARNCGACYHACAEGEECIHAHCSLPPTCDEAATDYGIEDMQASGGSELEDGFALMPGDTLAVEHTFQPGPTTLLLSARGLEGEPRPYVTFTIGETQIEPLLLAATSYATYSIEYESPGGPELVTLGVVSPSGATVGVAAIEGLELRGCASMYRYCEGGGYYLPELGACAPPVCSEASDCGRDFAGQSFLGECIDGACRYPSCTDRGASGLTIFEEFGPEANIEHEYMCFSYSELMFPLNNPRATSLEGEPDDFTCPSVEAITWEVERFRGEGSCVRVPICGPNTREDVGLLPGSNECCYLVSWKCGV